MQVSKVLFARFDMFGGQSVPLALTLVWPSQRAIPNWPQAL